MTGSSFLGFCEFSLFSSLSVGISLCCGGGVADRRSLSSPVSPLPATSSPATFPRLSGRRMRLCEFFQTVFTTLFSHLPRYSSQGSLPWLSLMRDGRKMYMVVQSKSFVFELVGREEDLLRISENGRVRRFSLTLPALVSHWLLRAWGRFGKSKSSSWFNQIRLGAGLFLLEFKRNRAGRFLQLSAIKQGQKSFIIFPASWNERGWTEIYDALKEIIKPHSLRLGVLDTKTSAQRSFPFCNMPPPPPMGCCPRCGFAGEPACFLRTFGQAVSTESLRPTLAEAEGPSSSMAV